MPDSASPEPAHKTPVSITQTHMDLICEKIATEGMSLAAILREDPDKLPSYTEVMRELVRNEAFRENYACAREAQGDYDADRVTDLANKVEKGELGHQEARVAIDAYKWSAGKRKPKAYGDSTHVKLSDPDGGPVKIDDTAASARLAAIMAGVAARAGDKPEE